MFKLFTRVLAFLILVPSIYLAAARPATAICGAPYLISTTRSVSDYSYIYTPGIAVGTGLGRSTVSPALEGFFWAFGHADAAFGAGADSGSFPAVNWLYTYPDLPAQIWTSWAAHIGIDGCIDRQGPVGLRGMGMFLIDELPSGPGAFALLASSDYPDGDFYFNQRDNAHIVLHPLAPLVILHSGQTGTGGQMPVSVLGPTNDSLRGGIYNGMGIVRYRVYSKTVAEGAEPPTDFQRSAWDDTGVEAPIGASTLVLVPCGSGEALYLSYALVLEGAWVAPILAEQSTRIECSPNLADPAPRLRTAPFGSGSGDGLRRQRSPRR